MGDKVVICIDHGGALVAVIEDLRLHAVEAEPNRDVDGFPAFGEDLRDALSDVRLDRSFVQKCVGLYPPWAEREFKNAIDAALSPDEGEDAGSIAALQTKWNASQIRVILDMDGDGILVLPEDVALKAAIAADEEDNQAKLRGTAAAWTYSKDGKRLLSSWQ